MKIEGLDYNTQRAKMVMPEYGRTVQNLVDYAVGLSDKTERQSCANAIVAIMERMFPPAQGAVGYQQKLWDHLAIMSDFKLDIDYPYDITQAGHISEKPEPMGYPMKRIPVKHYGTILFDVLEHLKTMPAGKERDELVRLTANQMKRDLCQWSNGSSDDEKVASDLAGYTDGRIQLDIDNFVFDKMDTKDNERKRRKR